MSLLAFSSNSIRAKRAKKKLSLPLRMEFVSTDGESIHAHTETLEYAKLARMAFIFATFALVSASVIFIMCVVI